MEQDQTSDAEQARRRRSNVWVKRARVAVAGLVHRPWQAALPTLPIVSIIMAISGVIAFALLIATVISGGGLHNGTHVVFLTAITCISASMTIRLNDISLFTCNDAFFLVSFFVLDPSDAAILVLIASATRFLVVRQSWVLACNHFANFLAMGIAGIAGIHAMKMWFDISTPVDYLAMGIVGYICVNLLPEVVYITSMLCRPTTSLNAVTDRPKLGPLLGESAQEFGIQILFAVPMAALGLTAWQVAPWSFSLIIVPFGMMWYSTRHAAALADARQKMFLDGLTGLANRAGFVDRAVRDLRVSHDEQAPVALIMGDLDNFKRVNDNLGHIVGDEVLQAAAAAFLRSREHGVQLVGRYGGEEFVALIRGSECVRAVEIAESIRADVEQSLSQHGTTISLGVAYLQWGDRLESLIDRADKALYAAKYGGKNRVYHRPPLAAEPDIARATPPLEVQIAALRDAA